MNKLLLLGAMLLFSTLQAADLGDAAPEVKVSKWVKGEPVKVTGGDDKIYVVEFWATWCPPCRTSIPHLTSLQKRFSDKVVIIGVTDEKEPVVKKFITAQGDKMDYRVVIDDDRATSKGYMEAFGIGGIPHAFIVQNKKIIWHGHPMAGLDKALDKVTSGKYDLATEKKRQEAEGLMEQFGEAIATGNDAEADKIEAKIQAAQKEGLFEQEFDLKSERTRIKGLVLRQQFMRSTFQGNEKEAEEAARKLKEVNPSINLDELRAEVASQKVANSYFQAAARGDKETADKFSADLASNLQGKAQMANEIAWTILTTPQIKHKDNELALRISKQACEDSKWEDAGFIDTYARALFVTGKKAEAIAMQQKAVDKAESDQKASLESTLNAYKKGQLPASE